MFQYVHGPSTNSISDPEFSKKVRPNFSQSGQIEIELNNEASGFLVLSETWAPSWAAKANDRAVKIHRANGSGMAIWIEKGVQRISLRYSPFNAVSYFIIFSLFISSFVVFLGYTFYKKLKFRFR